MERLLESQCVAVVVVIIEVHPELLIAGLAIAPDGCGILRMHLKPQPVATAGSRGFFCCSKQKGANTLPRSIGRHRDRIEPGGRAAFSEQDQRVAQNHGDPFADDQGGKWRNRESAETAAREVVGAKGCPLKREQSPHVTRLAGAKTQLAIPKAWRHGGGLSATCNAVQADIFVDLGPRRLRICALADTDRMPRN